MPRKSPTRSKATERFSWRGIKMTATHAPDYMSKGWSHIKLRVTSKDAPPIPITETGYLSHFLDEDELKAAGGPAAFFIAWLDREVNSKTFKRKMEKWRQPDLFA